MLALVVCLVVGLAFVPRATAQAGACQPNTHGPACSDDSNCTSIPSCLRYAPHPGPHISLSYHSMNLRRCQTGYVRRAKLTLLLPLLLLPPNTHIPFFFTMPFFSAITTYPYTHAHAHTHIHTHTHTHTHNNNNKYMHTPTHRGVVALLCRCAHSGFCTSTPLPGPPPPPSPPSPSPPSPSPPPSPGPDGPYGCVCPPQFGIAVTPTPSFTMAFI